MIISSRDAVRHVKTRLFCADPHLIKKKIIDLFGIRSIKFLFTHDILYVFLNLLFLTKLCCDHLSLCDRLRCITHFPYAVSHQVRGIQVVSLFPQTCTSIYTCTGTSDFQLIFWAGWGIGWGPTSEAAPKIVGPCAKFQSWFSVRTMCLSVRIHLRHQRQNWAHNDLCFTGYPDWAPHRDLAVTCGFKSWSLITIWFWTQVRH